MRRTVVTGLSAILLLVGLLSPALASSDSEIHSPGEVVYSDTLILHATYTGDTSYPTTGFGVKTTCEPRAGVVVNGTASTGGSSNVMNGAAYVSSGPTWDGTTFSATIDVSSWTLGRYCFAFNPGPSSTGVDRVEQEFYLADARAEGGGQILHDGFKVSFGGSAFRIQDSGLNDDGHGDWTVRFHEVSNDDVDKTTFSGDAIGNMNFFASGNIANFTVDGSLDGAPGYRLTVRAEDAGEPGADDTIRFELWQGSTKVYDTSTSGDFPSESINVGTARTFLDRGNLWIETR